MVRGRSTSTIHVLSLLMIILLHIQWVKSDTTPLAPALYVFGDSLLDSGNNNLLPTVAKAVLAPYGANFPRGPTGRFTNGRTVADFIAEYLKLPYSPPYISFRNSKITTGFNYASATCGILPETGKYLGGCLSLREQVDLFQKTVELELPKHYEYEGPGQLSDYLSKSLFLISIGSNDYINNYLQPSRMNSSKRYSPQSFAKLLIDDLSQQLKRLNDLGVRKVVVFEIGPIGCIPSITRQDNHNGQCVEEINHFVILFNNQLGTMLKNLSSTLEGPSFILAHVYSLAYNAIINPFNAGFTDTSEPCCKILSNTIGSCIPAVPPCRNVDKHFFWDGYHLTETAYSLTAGHCINDSTVCTPMNIKHLVQV